MKYLPAKAFIIFAMAITAFDSYSQVPRVAPTEKRKPSPCDLLSPEMFGVRAPYGSGDRTIEICINKCNYTPQEIDVIVFYSKTEAQLGSVSINPAAAYGHGKAKYVRTVGNILRYEYTFLHSGFRDINGPVSSEYKIIEMPSRDNNLNSQKVYYRIGVKRSSSNDLTSIATTSSFSMPDPITIGMVGDSFAAGEGAPIQTSNMFADPTQLWNDNDPETTTDVPCHRSYLSGQAQAAEKIRKELKKIAIAIKHVSCSGATVSEMALQKQNTNGIDVPLQFTLIKNWLNAKGYGQLDILLMGLGGNDIGFSQAIVDFMLNPFGNFSDDADAKKRFSDPAHGDYPFNDLKEAYNQLNNDIWGGSFFTLSSVGAPVLIHGYPSPCKGPNGSPWCGQEADWLLGVNNTVGDCWGVLEQDDKPNEFRDIHNIVLMNLNQTVEEGAQTNGWTFINMSNRSGNHGLSNCSQPYFNTLGQSISSQGDYNGMVHPNSNGYSHMYVEPLSNAIRNQIVQIRTYWESYGEEDCTAQEATRLAAQKKLAIEQAKRMARAKSSKKAYPIIKPYSTYRLRYSKKVDEVLRDYNKQIKEGKVKLTPASALSPDIIKNVDFSDKFSVNKTGVVRQVK